MTTRALFLEGKRSMRRVVASLLGLILLLLPVSIAAWGVDVHRLITRRAIAGLPIQLRPYFTARLAFVTEHSVDPDMWRIVNLKTDRGEEDPNHFLDIDGLDEPRPFTNVPRDWNAYVARYGADKANRMGRLPWRVEEIYKLLVSKFQDTAKNPAGYGPENAVYISAVLAHYIEDAHQPFHSVVNYDGQATNQRGIHGRFENELVMKNIAALKLAPVQLKPIPDIKEFVFSTLVAGEPLVDTILAADRQAATGREFFDAIYYTAFFKGARPILERRLSEAATAVASAITAAWTEAGKPAMPSKPPGPARIRR